MEGDVQAQYTDILTADMELALGSFLTVFCREPGWMAGFSELIPDLTWNVLIPTALPEDDSLPEHLLERGYGHQCSLYGEEAWLETVTGRLGIRTELEEAYRTTWMEYEGDDHDLEPTGLTYQRTTAPDTKQVFLELFTAAFGEPTDNGYELAPGYGEAIKRVMDAQTGPFEHHLVGYHDDRPVSIGTVTVKNGIGFLFNVATTPEQQGKGYGSAMTDRLIAEAAQHGPDRIVLSTEPGTAVATFYKKRGFTPLFEGLGLTGKDGGLNGFVQK